MSKREEGGGKRGGEGRGGEGEDREREGGVRGRMEEGKDGGRGVREVTYIIHTLLYLGPPSDFPSICPQLWRDRMFPLLRGATGFAGREFAEASDLFPLSSDTVPLP